MKRKGRKLKTGLYSIPIFLVFIMALSIYIVFHLAVNRYVSHLAEQNIEARFAVLDAYYQSSEYDGYYEEGSDFIIIVHHMIFDDRGVLQYPYAPWESEAEKERTEKIASCYANGNLNFGKQRGQRLKIGDSTWYLMQRSYTGLLDGGLVEKSAAGKTYSVLAYIDISPIASFSHLLDRVLLLLVSVLSFITAGLLLSVGKRLDHSFQLLKSYILRVGERQEVSRAKLLPYAEFNEITDTVFKMSEMIEAAEAAQVKFFQNASHDLRTPLTAIRGYAEGLAAGIIRDTKSSAAIIIDHSDKMSALVDDLLYASKLDARKNVPDDEVFDLHETLDRCIWSMTAAAKNAGLRLCLQTEDGPATMAGSEELIERALSNILSNALRYARTEIIISLSTADEQALITVEDDGEGIPPEELPHIFERFYKGRGGVTGIGLSITQEAVHLHGGSVTAASGDGYTLFTVTLPLKPA